MAKPSNRQKILAAGLRLVHARGFGAASVRDIVEAAGVPQGSFSNHFASKEAFGLEIIELYNAVTAQLVASTLRNEALAPRARLQAYIDGHLVFLEQCGAQVGCLYGNFSAELSDLGDTIRDRIVQVFAELRASVAHCLRAAVAAGELSPDACIDDLAGFVISSLQGALLLAKAERSPEPIENFARVLFRDIFPAS